MRFFNDVFDLGVRDERSLNIINFFVVFHLLCFFALMGWVIMMACRGSEKAFGDEVDKMRKQVETKKNK